MCPIRRRQATYADPLSTRRRMDEFAIPDIHADVRNLLAAGTEKNQIAPLQLITFHLPAVAILRRRGVRQIDADAVAENIADESAAIKTAGRAAPAAPVTDVTQGVGQVQQAFRQGHGRLRLCFLLPQRMRHQRHRQLDRRIIQGGQSGRLKPRQSGLRHRMAAHQQARKAQQGKAKGCSSGLHGELRSSRQGRGIARP